MRKALNISKNLCLGCRICQMACSLEKSNSFTPLKARIWILRDEHEGIDIPMVCRQCKEPPCEKACPVEGKKPISRDAVTGVVTISEDGCIKCYECVRACPFGAIRIDYKKEEKLIKCDLCGGDPECVKWCPSGAISFSELSTINDRRVIRGSSGGRLSESYFVGLKV